MKNKTTPAKQNTATTKWYFLNAEGKIRGCFLKEDVTLDGLMFPEASDIYFYPNGNVQLAFLGFNDITKINKIEVKRNSAVSTTYYQIYKGVKIDSSKYENINWSHEEDWTDEDRMLYDRKIEFYANGNLKSFMPATSIVIKGVKCKGTVHKSKGKKNAEFSVGNLIQLNEDGSVNLCNND